MDTVPSNNTGAIIRGVVLETPLFVAVSVVHDGIYIYEGHLKSPRVLPESPSSDTIKLRYHIYLGEKSDVYSIIAFDGCRILFVSNQKFYLRNIGKIVEKCTYENQQLPWSFNIYETVENNTCIIPTQVLSKQIFGESRDPSHKYIIDNFAKLVKSENLDEHNVMTNGEYDEINDEMKRILSTDKPKPQEFSYKSRGYYYVSTLQYSLYIFKRVKSSLKLIWRFSDPSLHKKYHNLVKYEQL